MNKQQLMFCSFWQIRINKLIPKLKKANKHQGVSGSNMIIILIKGPVQLYLRHLTLFARSVLALDFNNSFTISL